MILPLPPAQTLARQVETYRAKIEELKRQLRLARIDAKKARKEANVRDY